MPRAAGLVGGAPLPPARRGRRAGRRTRLRARATGCAASTGGCRCGPGSCTWRPPSPTGTPRWCCCSTCSPRPAAPAGSTARPRCWTPRSGPPPRSPSTTCTAATGSSLLEYGPAARRLRPAAGRRQYLTVLEWLLDVRADAVRRTSRTTRSSARSCSPRTRWWWCSPRCWTSGRREMLARLARSGRFVVAVDTLPADLPPPTGPALGRGGVPAVAAGAGEHDRPAPRARRAGGALGRRRQPRPGAAGRGPAGHRPRGSVAGERELR